MKEEAIEVDGVVAEVLPSAMFRVDLDNGHRLLATAAGKMRKFRIRIIVGDRVTVAVSPYDLGRGRITFATSSKRPPAFPWRNALRTTHRVAGRTPIQDCI